jgi:predicted transcriptional regulator
MLTKDEMLDCIQHLPEDATFEDALDRLFFLRAIKVGLAQAEAGNTISHEEVKRRMAEWR